MLADQVDAQQELVDDPGIAQHDLQGESSNQQVDPGRKQDGEKQYSGDSR